MPELLETERLLLRSADPRFARALTDYYVRNRAFFAPIDPLRGASFFTVPEQRSILRAEVREQRAERAARFYLFRRESPAEIIGLVGLNNILLGNFRSCYLSYKLDQTHLNRGYMTEAIEAVVSFAFTELLLHRIEANVMPRNGASLRVLEKCGFASEGLSPKYLRINGRWEDHIRMVRRNLEME